MNRRVKVTPIEKADSIITDMYYSFSKVKIDCDKNGEVTNNMINYTLTISSEDAHLKAYQSEKIRSASIEFWIIKNSKKHRRFVTNIPLSFIKENEQIVQAHFQVNLPPGKYQARFALPSALIYPSLNSSTIQLRVH